YGSGAHAGRTTGAGADCCFDCRARRTRCACRCGVAPACRARCRGGNMSWVTELARPEIVALKAYEHAVWEPSLERLHANELPWRSFADESTAGLNRYPEPQPRVLVERLAALYEVRPESVLVGRGSDEAVDLLVRGFSRAGQDSVVICPPTFGMYAVAARIQGAEVLTVPLRADAGFAL